MAISYGNWSKCRHSWEVHFLAEESFRLPVSSYDELKKVIQAYATIQQPVSLDEISHRTSLNKTIISKNHAFMTSIGLIEGTTKKAPTEWCKKLGHALHYEDHNADAVATAWQRVIQENDFLGKMVTAVRIRKGMDRGTLEGHIAYSAGQPKTPVVMTGARTVIDILRTAQVLVDDNDRFVSVALVPREERSIDETGSNDTSVRQQVNQSGLTGSLVNNSTSVIIRVDVKVAASPNELEDLGPKIRKMIDDLRGDSMTSVSVDVSREG